MYCHEKQIDVDVMERHQEINDYLCCNCNCCSRATQEECRKEMVEDMNIENGKEEDVSDDETKFFIPENTQITEKGYVTMKDIVNMLRKYKCDPSAIHFIADMLEA